MSKYKFLSYLILLIGVAFIAASTYAVVTYMGEFLKGLVTFVSTNDFSKLQQCGINPPPEFDKLRTEGPALLPILPFGYVVFMLVVSFLMFYAGYFWNKGKLEDDTHKTAQVEREVVHKIVNKMETERPPRQMPREEPEEEPEPEEEMAEEEPEEKPVMKKSTAKRRK